MGKNPKHIFGMVILIMLMLSCALGRSTAATEPGPPSPQPPAPAIDQPMPQPQAPGLDQPNPQLPPPDINQPNPQQPPPGIDQPNPQPPGQTPPKDQNLFRFVQTVAVTPDEKFLAGGFARIGYVPATDHLVVTFGTPRLAQQIRGCMSGPAYKEYTLDMQPAGKSDMLDCEIPGGDKGGLFNDNFYYDVSMATQGKSEGWMIYKYNAATWEELSELFYALDSPKEASGDMMVELENGILDISSGYSEDGKPPPPNSGGSTHHQFFTPDLEFIEKKILSDTPHICGSSLIFLEGTYYFISASAYSGDIIAMKYDPGWNYQGKIDLIKQGHWSEGVQFDGLRFYVSYLDTSQRTDVVFFPYYPNVHLAAFDREWNLLDDVAVTDYPSSEFTMTGRPWLLLHDNRLYVSYDVAPIDPSTGMDIITEIQAYVSVYELAQMP